MVAAGQVSAKLLSRPPPPRARSHSRERSVGACPSTSARANARSPAQANIVEKFVPGLGGKTDPIGPSPLIIHKEQLRRVARPWLEFTRKICSDREVRTSTQRRAEPRRNPRPGPTRIAALARPQAVQALGWVREMWGYAIAAASLGIRHLVLDAFQFEVRTLLTRSSLCAALTWWLRTLPHAARPPTSMCPCRRHGGLQGGSIGNRNRQLAWPVGATPAGPEGPMHGASRMPYYLFHYTYGIEYSREGLPMELQVAGRRPGKGVAPGRLTGALLPIRRSAVGRGEGRPSGCTPARTVQPDDDAPKVARARLADPRPRAAGGRVVPRQAALHGALPAHAARAAALLRA